MSAISMKLEYQRMSCTSECACVHVFEFLLPVPQVQVDSRNVFSLKEGQAAFISKENIGEPTVKKEKRVGNISGEQSSTRDRDQQETLTTTGESQFMSLQETTQPSTAGSEEEEASRSTDRYLYTATMGPEVGGSLLESDSVPPSSESEYFPTPEKRQRVAIMQQPVDAASLGRGMFVCLSSQVSAFLDQVNANMACRTPGCSGVYVPVRVVCEGLGGGLKVEIACNGCKIRRLTFDSSPMVESSRRTVVSLALQIAFYASGCTHAQYYRILKQSLGVQAVTCKPFYEMIKLVFPHVSDMLEEMGTEAPTR